MKSNRYRLYVIQRYLYGSLAIATIPLIVIALLYNQFSSNLLNDLLAKKLENELENANIKIKAFLDIQKQRLDNLADLPNIAQVFDIKNSNPSNHHTYDFLYFEAENPDIYEIVFFDVNDETILSIPHNRNTINQKQSMTITTMDDVDIIGPSISEDKRPGWILLKKAVVRSQEKIGNIGIKLRLSSLTELSAPLFQQDLYQPLLFFGNDQAWSATGVPQKINGIIAKSSEILPNWYIALDSTKNPIHQPNTTIRYFLLAIVIFSTITIILLFLHLAKKLNQIVMPLNEAAIKIAKGDFSVKVPETGPGEIHNLASSFNKMTTQLRQFISSQIATERRLLLGNLAAGIAHELRNPLATIKTAIYGLRNDEQQEEKRLLLSIVDDEITRLDNIIDELLDFAKPREPTKTPTSIDQVIKSITLLIDPTSKKQGVTFILQIEPDLVINVDPIHFRQILMNLFLNALEAMPNGGILRMEASKEENEVVIVISDTGSGMDQDTLNKIQNPFYTSKKKGLGLGLSICSQLSHANGGSLDIESQINRGTSVKLVFPQSKINQKNDE